MWQERRRALDVYARNALLPDDKVPQWNIHHGGLFIELSQRVSKTREGGKYTSSDAPFIPQVDRIAVGVDRGNFDGLLKGLAICWGRRHQGFTVGNRGEFTIEGKGRKEQKY